MSATNTTEEQIRSGIHTICESFFNDFVEHHGRVQAKMTEAYMQQIMLVEGLGAALANSAALSSDVETINQVVDQFCKYIMTVYFTAINESEPEPVSKEDADKCFEAARGLVDSIQQFVSGMVGEPAAAEA